MRLVWEHGPCTAERIREELDRPLKDSTIRTILRRLMEKGFVAHSVEGRTYYYRPLVEPRKAAARAVERIIHRFCSGSVEQLLVGLVDSKVVSRNELKALAARIAAAKGEEK